jgi:glycosyltransferase involved in cell wall biosynthesis
MNINYSFIIPHHNTPDLLQRLIDSIPERKDVEIIVVDDNSDDDKKPNVVRNDVQLYYIDKDHTKGAGRARNVGLEHARGKWLVFADSDDFFSDKLSDVLDKCINCDSDIIYFKVKGLDSGTLEPVDRGGDYNRRINNYLYKRRFFAEEALRYGHYVPWGKVIRKSMVDNNYIQFEEVRYSNDLMFATLIGHFAKKIEVLDIVAYYITIRDGSLVTQINIDSQKCRFAVDVRRLRFLCDNHKWKIVKSLRPTLLYIKKEYGLSELKDFIKIMKDNGIDWGRFMICEFMSAFYKIIKRIPYRFR